MQQMGLCNMVQNCGMSCGQKRKEQWQQIETPELICYIDKLETLNYLSFDMDIAQFGQFAEIDFEQFLLKSKSLTCKVIGTVTSISKHKKFIIEVLLKKKKEKVSVIRSYKRFSEFQALYQRIKELYPGYNIEEFPSKFQLFNKEETRKLYFQNLLNEVIKDYAKESSSVTRDFMRIIFDFLTFHIFLERPKKQKIETRKLQQKNQNVGNSMETDAKSVDGKKVIRIKQAQDMFAETIQQDRKHRGSVDLTEPTVRVGRTRSNSEVLNQLSTGVLEHLGVIPKTKKEAPVYDNFFQVKFANEESWKDGFLEVKGSKLYIYKNKLEIHFKTCIELYQIYVEFLTRDKNILDHVCDRTDLDLTRTFNEDENILSLYHEYDSNKLLIRKPHAEAEDLLSLNKFCMDYLKDQLMMASHISPIFEAYDGVFNPIGKLFVFIGKLTCHWKKEEKEKKVWARIRTGALEYRTIAVPWTEVCEINQGFLIPISNTFQRVKIECFISKDYKDKGDQIGQFKFSMVEFFAKPQRSLIEKLQVNLSVEQRKMQEYPTKLQLSLENLSDFSSIYCNSFASENDGEPLKSISGLDDLDDLSLSIDRILCIMGTISLTMTAFLRNAVKFKYPRMGYLFFGTILFSVLCLTTTQILRGLIAFILMCVIYQQRHANIIISFLLSRFVFSHIHPDFKRPEVLTTKQISNLKWSNHMSYIAEDYEFKDGKIVKKDGAKRDVHKFIIHDRVFIVKEEEQSFFQKMRGAKRALDMIYKVINGIAFTLEKIANLLSWIDYRKTVFVAFILLILAGITSGAAVEFILCAVCLAKIIKGPNYYRYKLYEKNRSLAIYSLRYILQKQFPEIIGDKNIHKNMDEVELGQYIGDLSFPVNDASAMKKLKNKMEYITGVYVEPEALYPKTTKDGKMKLVYLIDMIETCEEKLSVNLIGGEEGISDEYQQLREETKDIVDIDDWLADSAKNFVMNIPSRLFMIFHKSQLDKIEKAENRQQGETETKINEKQLKHQLIPKNQNINQEQAKKELESRQQNKQEKDMSIQQAEEAKEKLILNKQVSLQ